MTPLKLRALPFHASSLSPALSAQSVELHHGILQAKYVRRYNEAVALQKSGKVSLANAWDQLYNASGVILHEMYWENLVPKAKSTEPSAALLRQIVLDFGSPGKFIQTTIELGVQIPGSGWIVLAWVPRLNRLIHLTIQNHENNWIPTAVPLLVLDVWEHAYYLDYETDRRTYLSAMWNHIDWATVSRRFASC